VYLVRVNEMWSKETSGTDSTVEHFPFGMVCLIVIAGEYAIRKFKKTVAAVVGGIECNISTSDLYIVY
jgi:hypothetical protein